MVIYDSLGSTTAGAYPSCLRAKVGLRPGEQTLALTPSFAQFSDHKHFCLVNIQSQKQFTK